MGAVPSIPRISSPRGFIRVGNDQFQGLGAVGPLPAMAPAPGETFAGGRRGARHGRGWLPPALTGPFRDEGDRGPSFLY